MREPEVLAEWQDEETGIVLSVETGADYVVLQRTRVQKARGETLEATGRFAARLAAQLKASQEENGRLRARRDALHDNGVLLDAENKSLLAENGRLREALERVKRAYESPGKLDSNPYRSGAWYDRLLKAARAARAALGARGEEGSG